MAPTSPTGLHDYIERISLPVSEKTTMPIVITPLTEEDIPGAIDTSQQAFADNPYNHWIYDDRSKLSLARNRVSLGIHCRWGIRNALFHVAKDRTSAMPIKVLGVAMWLPKTPLSAPQTWEAWFQSWLLWLQQLGMNAYYRRGGLNVRRYWIWKANQAIAQKELWTDEAGIISVNYLVAGALPVPAKPPRLRGWPVARPSRRC